MKRLTHLSAILITALVLLIVSGCASVDKLVERGNYEEAIELAQRKLSGKQRKNPKYVRALEEAFNRVTLEDMERARRNMNSGNPDWASIRSIYQRVQRRQDALQPLIPLVDKNGYEARLRFAKVDELIVKSGENAARQIYEEGMRQLTAGRAGDKTEARAAYRSFQRVLNYRQNYRDTETLIAESLELGKVYIQVEMANRTGGYLPRGFEQELLRPSAYSLDDNWHFYDFSPVRGRTYDYTARISINNIAVSPERVNERSYVDQKEIEDGEEYVLDANGNVAKDTLGNDITRPRVVVVQAQVVEVLQTKNVIVQGGLEVLDNRTRRVVDRDEITAEAIFENYASTYQGDRRALSDETRRYIGNQPVNFPSDEALILDAADALKSQLEERLARSNRVI